MSPLLAGLATALCLAGAATGYGMLRSAPAGTRDLVADDGGRKRQSLLARLNEWLGRRYGHRFLALMSQKRVALVRQRIDAAGRPDGLTLQGFAAKKAASTVTYGGAGLVLTLLTASPFPAPALALLGWLLPDFALAGKAKRRQKQIDRDLPDFLDILVVTVGAGLGFRNALGRVAEAVGGPLGEEMRTVLRQMALGSSRRAAFTELRDRNESEPLAQFVTALLQAEELGAPLADTLHAIAADMRKSFHQRARRHAAKAVPRVSLVITTVIVPGVIVLILSALFVSTGASMGALTGG